MSYKVEPIDVTGTAKEKVVDPRAKKDQPNATAYKWWLCENENDMVAQALSTVEFLKRTNANRIKQASVFSRLLSGKPLNNFLAANSSLDSSNQLPIGRPTANVCYSCTDTLVSRLSQDKPKPIFLTDNGHYKERKLAKEANAFMQGELFRTHAYTKGPKLIKDACTFGDGFIKVFERNKKVCLERTLPTELLVDFNDGYYSDNRQLCQIKLVDRSLYSALYPDKEGMIQGAVHGNVDSTPRSTETISDQFIMAELWHLPSSPDAGDGRHVIVCSQGAILDEKDWKKERFPFAHLGYNENPVGFFNQGLIEILMPTQMEIYRMLIIESQSIEIMGVPRIYISELSSILETSFNNRIGTIIKGSGEPPVFFSPDAGLGDKVWRWIQWLITNAYQMSGISAMSAGGQKPQGLNSGEAIRSFDQIQEDRFAALAYRYQQVFPELSYLMIDCATDIADENKGKYSTVFPDKNGTREIDFKNIKALKNTYVIQCYEESSLPKDPAGRQAKLSEMRADGEISQQEFRRLSNFPDLEQSDQLAAALEERILFCLDDIVETGELNYPPDAFMLDPEHMALTISTQYVNKYAVTDMKDDVLQKIRDWNTQVQDLEKAAMPPPMPQPQQAQSLAPPTAPPAAPIGPASGVAA